MPILAQRHSSSGDLLQTNAILIGNRYIIQLFCQEVAIMAVKPIPDGYQAALPYLIVNNADGAIEFYKQAFGAVESMRLATPSGKVVHAEIQIDQAHLMVADEFPEMGYRGPLALGGSPVTIMLYVEAVDQRFAQALAAGAKMVRPVQDQFYGDRSGSLSDPFGHVWILSTHIEDVPKTV
jgi:PhnB protein